MARFGRVKRKSRIVTWSPATKREIAKANQPESGMDSIRVKDERTGTYNRIATVHGKEKGLKFNPTAKKPAAPKKVAPIKKKKTYEDVWREASSEYKARFGGSKEKAIAAMKAWNKKNKKK